MSINSNNIVDVADITLAAGQRAIMISTSDGNIVVPVGVGSFVAGGKVYVEAQKTVSDHSTSASSAIDDNTRYVYTNPLTQLNISAIPQTNLESEVVFTAGADFSLSMPADINTIGALLAGDEPFVQGKRYVIALKNNEAIAYSYNEVSA